MKLKIQVKCLYIHHVKRQKRFIVVYAKHQLFSKQQIKKRAY